MPPCFSIILKSGGGGASISFFIFRKLYDAVYQIITLSKVSSSEAGINAMRIFLMTGIEKHERSISGKTPKQIS
jgi:hypothetical protein